MKKFTTLLLVVAMAFVMVLASSCSTELKTPETSNSSETSQGDNSRSQTTSQTQSNVAPNSSSTSVNGNSQTTSSQKASSQGTNSATSTKSNSKTSTTNSSVNSTTVTDSNIPTGGDIPAEKSGDIYVSTTGSDSNPGTKGSPLATLTAAVSKATAGTTIFMNAGVYKNTQRINLTASGTESAPITIQAVNWGKVELNFYDQTPGNNSASAIGVYLPGSYWKIQGIDICYAGDNGLKIEGSHNYIGRCTFHHNLDTGLQMGFGHDKSNPNGAECSYNTVENCDSYLNCDHDANYGADADGFACKMFSGIGNRFIGCRSWRNADDAWDLYEMDFSVLIQDCWAWESGKKADFINGWVKDRVTHCGMAYRGDGSFNGNGNGIKLGGNSSKGVQEVINCVAFGCNISGSVKGFDQNHNAAGIHLENCVAWDNGYNYMLDDSPKYDHLIKNSLSLTYKIKKAGLGEVAGNGSVQNCNFVLDGGDLTYDKSVGTLTGADFITLEESDALAPRESDGSLPNNGFARLKTTSPFYGKGMGLK